MKRLFVFLFLLGCICAAEGGGWKNILFPVRNIRSYTKGGSHRIDFSKAEKLLKKRVWKTQMDLEVWPSKGIFLEEVDLPASQILNWSSEKMFPWLYKEEPLFKELSLEGKQNYFLVNNNRLIKRLLMERALLAEQIAYFRPELLKGRKSLPAIPPGRLMASLIEEDVSQIYIGEFHRLFAVQHSVLEFLRALRERFPKRKIVVLSEFLIQDVPVSVQLASMWKAEGSYVAIFSGASKMGMPLYGLEPFGLVNEGKEEVVLAPAAGLQKEESPFSIWLSPEGMRLRNKAWAQKIREVRQENPNALFVVYAGAAHLAYNEIYGLPNLFPEEKSFVGFFYPNDRNNWDWIDFFGGKAFAKASFLHFEEKNLAKLAGFNVRIKVPKALLPVGGKP